MKRVKEGDISYPFINSLLATSLGESGDVSIVVDDERFEMHSSILCATSPVFKNMVASGMRESQTKEITFETISKRSWVPISKFIYSGNVTIEDDESAIEIVKFAHLYDMNVLMILAESKLKEFVTGGNAVDRLVLSDQLGLQSLRKKAIRTIAQEFLVICETKEFRDLPFKFINEILERDDLLYIYELDKFEAIHGWNQHRFPKPDGTEMICPWRNAEAQYLIRHLDFKTMGIGEMKAFGKHPGTFAYPFLLTSLLSDMKTRPNKAWFPTERYVPDMKAKRFTFLFRMKPIDLTANGRNSPWHLNDKNNTNYRLRIDRDPDDDDDDIYSVTIEPVPVNVKISEIFVFPGFDDVKRAGIYPAEKGLCFGKDDLDEKRVITFGATIFD